MTDSLVFGSRLMPNRQKFNLDLAYKEVGGFGKFQCIALAICGNLRNASLFLYYPFAMLTAEQPYLCRTSPETEFSSCDKEQVCSAM